jgi:hypothetical protein
MATVYASERAQVVPGALIKHVTTGGMWTVIYVNEDGSVFARSDMGARRTVKAEHVDKGLEMGKWHAQA